MKLFLEVTFKPLYYFLTQKEYRAFYLLLLSLGGTKRYVKKNVRFLNYRLIVPDALSFIWQAKEIFADESYKFKADHGQPFIVDCGANIGMSCLYFKRLFPDAKIIAFEADPQVAAILKQNLENNSAGDVTVMQKAVWKDNNGVHFHMEGSDSGAIATEGQTVFIPSYRLKDLLDETEQVDLLKIDIEGAEYEVLKDCRTALRNVRHLFIEYHSRPGSPQQLDEVLTILRENNFRYFIHPLGYRKAPFVNRKKDAAFDLQLNIFAWPESREAI